MNQAVISFLGLVASRGPPSLLFTVECLWLVEFDCRWHFHAVERQKTRRVFILIAQRILRLPLLLISPLTYLTRVNGVRPCLCQHFHSCSPKG